MTLRIAMLSVHACALAKLGGRDSGGMNVYIRELARDLARRGIEVDIFTRWREAEDPRVQELAPGARVIHIESGPIGYYPKMSVYERLPEFTEKLLAFVKAEGRSYDLIHSHYWLSAEVSRTLAAEWAAPRIQMFHTLGRVRSEVMDEDADGENAVRAGIEERAVAESRAVVAASEIEAGELRTLYGADMAKVAIIPCGVDPEVFRPVRQLDARRILGEDGSKRLILFVGRIEQIKGIDVLLRALGLLYARRPDLKADVRLVVVGGALSPHDDAPETDKVADLRRHVREQNLESSVEFVGSRDQRDLALYYASADVCAVPSLTESFGLVALEAMACGTPVVGTRVGGLQTLIEDGQSGMLVPPSDEQALAEALERVLLDPRLRMHLAHGAREAAEGYTWQRVGDRIADLYRRILSADAAKVEG
ncbi:MAG: glycosyltransferase family 1 protein [Chloroflexi bacterium]|nr:glycosyltransferase family 1 protein [Chloroflexota bacterium]